MPRPQSNNIGKSRVFVVWSRWGFLTIPIVVITSIVTMIFVQLFKAIGQQDLIFLAISLGLFASAAANWFIGKRMNAAPPRRLIDPVTNDVVLLYNLNKLFWIRLEYWSVPVIFAGVFTLFSPILR